MTDAASHSQDPAAPPRTLQWAAKTDIGRFRKVNQDAYLMFAFNNDTLEILPNDGEYPLDGTDIILAVSDGMGGGKLGHRASSLALSKLGDIIPRNLQNSHPDSVPDYHDFLSQAVYEAHQAVNHEASHYDECEGMGATLSICWFTNTSVHIAHVGDSRVYMHAGKRLRQITHDHTMVGRMQRAGELTEMQARNHPRRNALSQAIGAGAQGIVPQLISASHAPGDLYLICSDGLVDGLWDKNIDAQFQLHRRDEATLPETRDALMRDSLATGGRDNITLIAAEVF